MNLSVLHIDSGRVPELNFTRNGTLTDCNQQVDVAFAVGRHFAASNQASKQTNVSGKIAMLTVRMRFSFLH